MEHRESLGILGGIWGVRQKEPDSLLGGSQPGVEQGVGKTNPSEILGWGVHLGNRKPFRILGGLLGWGTGTKLIAGWADTTAKGLFIWANISTSTTSLLQGQSN